MKNRDWRCRSIPRLMSLGYRPGAVCLWDFDMAALGCHHPFRTVRAASACVFWTLLTGLALGGPPGELWQAPLGQDHPLVGRIWDVTAGELIDSAALVDRLRRGRFVLLGEKHDNRDHHRLQAWLLRALIAAGRRPAVGFEMFTADDAPAIARQLAAHPTDAVGLAEAVNWQRSGWPDWAMYQPIAEAALQLTLRVDVDHVCDAVLVGVERVFAPRMTWIALHDEAADMLHVRFCRGHGAEVLRYAKVPPGKGLTGQAFSQKRAIFVPDARCLSLEFLGKPFVEDVVGDGDVVVR